MAGGCGRRAARHHSQAWQCHHRSAPSGSGSASKARPPAACECRMVLNPRRMWADTRGGQQGGAKTGDKLARQPPGKYEHVLCGVPCVLRATTWSLVGSCPVQANIDHRCWVRPRGLLQRPGIGQCWDEFDQAWTNLETHPSPITMCSPWGGKTSQVHRRARARALYNTGAAAPFSWGCARAWSTAATTTAPSAAPSPRRTIM